MTIIDKIAPIKITPVVPVIKQRNNNNLCSSGFKVHVVSSDKVENFHKSLEEIIEQLKELSENEIPIKLSLFSECKTKLDYSVKCKQVQAILDSNKFIIQFSLIAQRPANNNALVAEITTINFVANKSEIIKNQENYTIINHKGLEVLIACIQPTIEKNFEDSVMTSFNVLDNILIESGFRYRDIVRQWNYIEDILQIKNNDTGIRQNYQLFNDIRAIHYSSDKFHHGYPAATGIGTASGTCNIEILAIKNENIKIKAILNNRQKNAHNYSGEVLIGASKDSNKSNASPKFERAKLIHSADFRMLFVSGTASIIGEKTVYKNDIIGQTLTTIENINILLDEAKADVGTSNFQLSNYRVYIKNPIDYHTVKYICQQNFKGSKGVFVIADVCRDDLLVEIECIYNY